MMRDEAKNHGGDHGGRKRSRRARGRPTFPSSPPEVSYMRPSRGAAGGGLLYRVSIDLTGTTGSKSSIPKETRLLTIRGHLLRW